MEHEPPTFEPQEPPPPDPAPRSNRYKFLAGLVALVGVMVVTLAAGVYLAYNTIKTSIRQVAPDIPLLSDETVLDEIAFVGNDFNLWQVEPDGSNLRRLTTDGQGYRFPTWSPDGRQLAFLGRGSGGQSVLYVSPTGRSEPTVVYQNPQAAPFYLYWSPDSRAITFLTQEPAGLAMRLVEPDNPASERVLGLGSPFYWVWSPQSDRMLLHVGGSRAVSSEAHISLLANQADAAREDLNLNPGGFQAPGWSTDGAHFYTIAADETGREAIYQTDAQTLSARKLADTDGFAHLVLSPANNRLAYLQLTSSAELPFGQAFLMDTDGQNKKQIMDSPVASIYWSPDGQKLALLSLTRPADGPSAKIDGRAAPLPQAIALRWWVYDIKNDDLQPLFTFRPTTAFMQTIPYFDQYSLSLTFWSPDSRYLLATKAEPGQNMIGSVYVLDTTGAAQPLKVGDGTLAVWSWQ